MIGHNGSSKNKATSYYPEEDYFSQPSRNSQRNRPSSSRPQKRAQAQSLTLTDGNNNGQNHARVRRSKLSL